MMLDGDMPAVVFSPHVVEEENFGFVEDDDEDNNGGGEDMEESGGGGGGGGGGFAAVPHSPFPPPPPSLLSSSSSQRGGGGGPGAEKERAPLGPPPGSAPLQIPAQPYSHYWNTRGKGGWGVKVLCAAQRRVTRDESFSFFFFLGGFVIGKK